MITIKLLTGTSFEDIAIVFNEAFSDYYVPIHFTAKQFEDKFASENGIFELSVGAYVGDKLVGFILHYYNEIDGQKVIYNGGTGVVPTQRGNGITTAMYDYILPILRERGIGKLVHEVLDINAPAIKVYSKVGFKQSRSLYCFKGVLAVADKPSPYKINEIKTYDWVRFQSFWDQVPTWQNSILALGNLKGSGTCLGIFLEETLLGYIIYRPMANRINQLAVHKDFRQIGLGRQLLCEVARRAQGNSVTIINVDSRCVNMKSMFEKYGLEVFIEQYELQMDL